MKHKHPKEKTHNTKTKRDARTEAKSNFIWWGLLMLLLIFSDITMGFLEAKLEVFVVSVAVTVFWGVVGIHIINDFFKCCIKPENAVEKMVDSTMEARLEKIKKRKKGKDIFEIVDQYRRQYFSNMIVVLIICTFLIMGALIVKMNEYSNVNIPYYWGIIVAIAIVIISVAVTYKVEFAFTSSKDLRDEIQKHGYDETRVNADIMLATYHDLFKGFMAIGLNYYMVILQECCRVGNIKDIILIENYVETTKYDKTDIIKYFIGIQESKGKVNYFRCGDKIAADLIAREFIMLGLEVKDVENSQIYNSK